MNARLPDSLFTSARLEQVFNDCFLEAENTRLLGGAPEPIYVPAGEEHDGESSPLHRLYYREDFFASGLHEVAHWCIAGPARRRQRDFGYWYAPDGRDPGAQAAFEAVEVAPQALEWCFSQACGRPFRVSLDNLDAGTEAGRGEQRFFRAVAERARQLQQTGLPSRATRFFTALAAAFGTGLTVDTLVFDVHDGA